MRTRKARAQTTENRRRRTDRPSVPCRVKASFASPRRQTSDTRGRRAQGSFCPLSSVICRPTPFLAGLVALARRSDPIPSRTRPSNALAPMVLCLKTWESRSSPGLPRTENTLPLHPVHPRPPLPATGRQPGSFPHSITREGRHRRSRATAVTGPGSSQAKPLNAGWSSPVARQAHNLKAAGSNPAPATTVRSAPEVPASGAFCCFRGIPLRQCIAIRCPARRGTHGVFDDRARIHTDAASLIHSQRMASPIVADLPYLIGIGAMRPPRVQSALRPRSSP